MLNRILACALLFPSIVFAAPPNPPQTTQPLPQTKWSFTPPEFGNNYFSITNPVVTASAVYIGDEKGTLRALKPANGDSLWTHEHAARIYAITADDQNVYFTSDGGLTAITSEGKPAWNFLIAGGGSGHGSAVWAPDDLVFVAGNDGFVYALSRTSGKKVWATSLMDDVPPDPPGFPGQQARFKWPMRPTGIATDGKIVCQSIMDQSRVVALDPHTGNKRWSFQAKGWVDSIPLIDEKYVFIGSQDKNLYCISRETGKEVWKFSTKSRVEVSPAIFGDTLYVTSCDAYIYAVSVDTGKELWKFKTDLNPRGSGPIYSTPVVTKDALYFNGGEGQTYALNPKTGDLLWKIRPAPLSDLYSTPASDGKHLFITSRQSYVGDGPDRVAQGAPSLIALDLTGGQ